MLGDVYQLAENLWFIAGKMPADAMKEVESANAVYYRTGEHGYLIDSGVGSVMRASILHTIAAAGPLRTFTLLNSHGHADHTANNDLIEAVQAPEKHHYLAEAGWRLLDPVPYFAARFLEVSKYYDPLGGYQAHRLQMRLFGIVRALLTPFFGERAVAEVLMGRVFAKYHPLRPSPTTIEPYESLPRRDLSLGKQDWSGWALGDGNVWVLEERGHSPDEVLIYFPEHRFLHAGDLTMALFPTWPDSDEKRTREMLGRVLTLARDGHVRLLTDGHSHTSYRDDAIARLLQTLLADHECFRTLLARILAAEEGLTIGQIYNALSQETAPVVEKYRALEFPHTPPPLQNVILALLLQSGYTVRGPTGNKRFYRPAIGRGKRSHLAPAAEKMEVANG